MRILTGLVLVLALTACPKDQDERAAQNPNAAQQGNALVPVAPVN